MSTPLIGKKKWSGQWSTIKKVENNSKKSVSNLNQNLNSIKKHTINKGKQEESFLDFPLSDSNDELGSSYHNLYDIHSHHDFNFKVLKEKSTQSQISSSELIDTSVQKSPIAVFDTHYESFSEKPDPNFHFFCTHKQSKKMKNYSNEERRISHTYYDENNQHINDLKNLAHFQQQQQ